jgi:hypothetical protein
MKISYLTVGFSLLGVYASCCLAQDVKTVAQCRAYREAWLTSRDTDTKSLPVRELLLRGEQMITCAKEIDAKPLETGMTYKEGLDVVAKQIGYAGLAETYFQEAFGRAAWFIQKKNLTKEFIAEDEVSKTVRNR